MLSYTAVKLKTNLQRTIKGDELAEKALGLKNFINEFSKLSEKTKEEVMLWDDVLVYAVVLEENDAIIENIMRNYTSLSRINLRSFTSFIK